MDINLAEPDVAKKNVTDNQEFFNYINNSDSNKRDVWPLDAEDRMKNEAASNLGWTHWLSFQSKIYLYVGNGREPKASRNDVNDISRSEVEA